MYKEAFSKSKLFKFGAMALLLAGCNLAEKPEGYVLRKTFDSLYSAPAIADLSVVLEDLAKFGDELSILQNSETGGSMFASLVFDTDKKDYTYYEFHYRKEAGLFGAKFGFSGIENNYDSRADYAGIDVYKDFLLIPGTSILRVELIDPAVKLDDDIVQRIRSVSFKINDNNLERFLGDQFTVISPSNNSKVEISRHEGRNAFRPDHYEIIHRINFYSGSDEVLYDADRIKIYDLGLEIKYGMGSRYENGSFYIQNDPEELYKNYLDWYLSLSP